MKKTNHIFALAVAVICLSSTVAFAELPTTTGRLSKVTVYRGQALVTRTIDVDLPPGTSELILANLPNKIVPESLYAQTSADIRVLSVRYREKAVEADTRKEVKELDSQIEDINNKLYQNQRDRDISLWLFSHFEGQWKLSIDSANTNLNRGVLESEPIEKLTKYLEGKAIELQEKTVELEFQKKELQKQLNLLNRKRDELNAGRSRTQRQAVLFISNKGGKKTSIELSYLVNGANWLPQYNLRANPDKSKVLIEYNAVVNQTSGEDWNSVALSLSTAEPAMVAAAPVLEPMSISLTSRQNFRILTSLDGEKRNMPQQAVNADSRGRYVNRSEDFKKLISSRRQQSRRGKASQSVLSKLAVDNQLFDFDASRKEVAQMQQTAIEISRTEGVSVTYKLPGKLTLPSRTDQQLVTIAAITTDADFTLVATPLLTDYVYLQAELLNDSDTILLPGPASMFRNGEFVGKSQLPIVTIGDKFTAGFGIDSQVQVTRELADKRTRIQGGNRIDTYHYRIALSNYKKVPAKLRLLDRLPYTDNNSIKIELGKTEPALSKDDKYLPAARKNGILRWDMDLEPNSIDQNTTIVKYSFTMEYDKNMQIQPRRAGK